MTQFEYYTGLLYNLVLTGALVGAIAFVSAIAYVIYILRPYVGPRK